MEVTLIDHMGNDLRVVNAARVSFAKESKLVESEVEDIVSPTWYEMTGEKLYVQVLSEQDQKLIKYLANHNHWTPFSHVQITMREKVPIFVARQRFKHMVGFTYNEVSRRYVDDDPEFFVPDAWRKRAENKKQGSGENLYSEHDQMTQEDYKEILDMIDECYKTFLKRGVAPEQARMVLPQSLYTEYYVTGSLAAWARAYKLRVDSHSQKEIQDLAAMWDEKISTIGDLKYSWKALTE
jgi:thymidylate synthase (FAD)